MTGYTAPSTGRAVRAVLFDTFGTVVDWRSGISSAVRAFAADHALTLDPGAFAPGELTSLTAAWHYLPPWPDSAEGIRQLKRHFIVGPLSSGHTALLVHLAKAAGLPWDVILGSDISRAYKPSLDAYQKPVSRPRSSPARPNTAPVKSRTWPPLMTGT
ncbi:MAG TPA: hypothetical protein VFW50_22325 [Streptosporangiaceae bacterium]|nr:hypothetical protein [Streptosporangiaceae bacterium]